MLKEMDRKSLVGISCILCGVLYLLRELNIFCSHYFIFDPKMYPLYISAIFLFAKQREVSIISFIVGLVLWFPSLVDLMDSYAHLLWPLVIIAVGVILVFGGKGFARKQKGDDTIEDAKIVDEENSEE